MEFGFPTPSFNASSLVALLSVLNSMPSCPTPNELRTLHDAKCGDAQRELLDEHVRSCVACQQVLAHMTAEIQPIAETLAGTNQPINPTAVWIAETLAAGVNRDQNELGTTPIAAGPMPRVPGYEVTDEIGRGGMGVVYRARHIALNRLVALKTIRSLADSQQLARFNTEAEALAQIQHPHIVQVFEIGNIDDTPFLTMEFVAGTTLEEAILAEPFTPVASAQCVEQLARAMFSAHQRGVLHRDLKPSNILLTEDGQPKITDFGLAKCMTNDSQMTVPETIMGTPSYMPPEQAQGRLEDVGPQSDIYSLGAILYELLTGRPPFRGSTPLDTVQQVVQRDPPSPRSLAPKIPRDLETICLKCLHKQAAGRYATAADLADDLRRFQLGEPIAARRIGPLGRGWRWCQRNRSLTLALAITFVVIAVGAAAVMWQRNQTNEARLATQQQYLRFTAEADEKFNLIEDLMQRIPEEQRAQDERLRSALNSYEQWLADEPSGEAARASYAAALFRVAEIRRRIGQYELAKTAYRRAISLYQELITASPDELEYRRGWVEAFNWLGESFRESGQPAEAITAYEEAIFGLEQVAKGSADDSRYMVDIARSHYNRALARIDLEQHADAEADLRLSIKILEELRGNEAPNDRARQSLARSHANLGILLRATQRSVEGYQQSLQATAIYQSLTDDKPGEPEYRLEQALALNNLANLLLADQRSGELGIEDLNEQASSVSEKSVGILSQLVQEYANVPQYRKELANSLNGLGAIRLAGKAFDAAERSWQSAAEELKSLVDQSPDVAEYYALLAQTTFNLAYLSHQQKRVEDRVKLLGEAIDLQRRAAALSPANVQFEKTLKSYEQTASRLNR